MNVFKYVWVIKRAKCSCYLSCAIPEVCSREVGWMSRFIGKGGPGLNRGVRTPEGNNEACELAVRLSYAR
jgi:hypothetical protein